MCGRYTLTDADPQRLRDRFGTEITSEVDVRPRFNVAPTDPVLAIRERVREGEEPERRAGMLRWGLIPHWAEAGGSRQLMINARAESVAERPAFRVAFQRRRCLVPADGFYEWRKLEDGTKQPVWAHRGDGDLFAFAGIWEPWRGGGEGELVLSLAIITCEANELNSQVHDRMPVILAPDQEDAWLSHDTPELELHSILEPRPWPEMELREVSRLVNDVANDGPEVLGPPEGQEQEQLF